MAFLAWIESWAFCTWVRESGTIWGEPMLLFLHTIGMCMIAGVSAVISLALLGCWPKGKVPIRPLEQLYPIMWAGWWLNLASGSILLLADATTKIPSVVFWAKMGFVLCGVWVLARMRRQVFGDPELDKKPISRQARQLAWVSLLSWLGAIEAGRLMAYLGPVSGLGNVSNH